MAGECVPCGGGRKTGMKQSVSGGARGGLSMRRTSTVGRAWIVTCPDGGQSEVVGDTAAYQAAAACGGSYSPKP